MMLLEQQPMWTDKVQAYAGVAGILSALIGFIILFIRDRNKENQIQKLSDIADNLSQMVVTSEKRYINTRKPILDISMEILEDRKEIKVKFLNKNLSSTLESYRVVDLERKYYDTILSHLTSSHQEFGIILHYDNNPNEFNVLYMRYETSEGYVFMQSLILFYDDPEPNVNQDPMFTEDEAPYREYLS